MLKISEWGVWHYGGLESCISIEHWSPREPTPFGFHCCQSEFNTIIAFSGIK